MHKAELDRFVEYHRQIFYFYSQPDQLRDKCFIDKMYSLYDREFVRDLPVKSKTYDDGDYYSVIRGTNWMHSLSGPAFIYNSKPLFYILGWPLTLDEWLPLSSLSSDERTLFKLKYG